MATFSPNASWPEGTLSMEPAESRPWLDHRVGEGAVQRIVQNVLSIPYKVRNDLPLLELARAGNSNAYDEFVLRYEGRIYALALGITGNDEDASAAIRDAVVWAYRSLQTLGAPQESPRSWLCRHAVRASLARVLARRRGGLQADAGAGPVESV